MSVSIITPQGPVEVPVRGGVNLEFITRVQDLENKVSDLQQELTQVKNSKAGEEPGLTRLSNSQTVTNSIGLALPTSEKNSGINGTLANGIEKVNRSLDLTMLQIDNESDGGLWTVGKTYTAAEIFSNFRLFQANYFWEAAPVTRENWISEEEEILRFQKVELHQTQNKCIIQGIHIIYSKIRPEFRIDAAYTVSLEDQSLVRVVKMRSGETIFGFGIYGLLRRN